MIFIDITEILFRLMLAIVMAGVIGYEREHKNRPAGIRTHILVCVGAAIISLIQVEIGIQSLKAAVDNPGLIGVIRSDEARLIAQIVSGIGFLGAGTIIVTKRSVKGLTTAASLWATAGLGIAVGMGYYNIAIIGFITIMFSLSFVKKIIRIKKYNNIEIRYIHREETKKYISEYFEKNDIFIEDVTFEVQIVDEKKYYKNVYTVDMPKDLRYSTLIEDLSIYPDILGIRLVSIAE